MNIILYCTHTHAYIQHGFACVQLRQLRAEGLSDKGIFSKSIPLGTAIFIDMTTIGPCAILHTCKHDMYIHMYNINHCQEPHIVYTPAWEEFICDIS